MNLYHESFPPVITPLPIMTHGHNPGQVASLLLHGSQTNGAHSLTISALKKGSDAQLHIHSREDETFYVLEGELDAQVGEEHFTVVAGQSLFLPRGLKHRLRCNSETAQILMIIHPAGLEDFFTRIDTALEEKLSPAAMGKIAAEFGVTILHEG